MPTTAITRLRRGTAASWASANPVLEAGQAGFETDTRKMKVGDGTTAWNSLSYTAAVALSHTHTASDITDFAEAVDDRVAALAVAGANMTITYDDTANTLTFASTGGGGGVSDGDKGDITVSGAGTVWTIDNGAVGTAKLGGDITTAGKALLDDVDAAAQRTTLGLGTAATQASTAFAAASHTHIIADTTGLQAALDGKASTTHTHIIADTTGLQAALDGKAASSHTHTASQISDSTTAGRALLTAVDAAAQRTSLGLGTAATSASGDFAPIAHVSSGGTAHANATTSVAGFMSAADKTKLDGVASGATANNTDSFLLSRANHTGTQTASTISDFSEAVDDRVSALVVQGANMTITYDDVANTLTFAAATGGSPSFGNGSAAAPSLAPTTDSNTGWYFDGLDKILVSVGGVAYGGWNTSRSQYEVGSQIGFVPANQTLFSSTRTLNSYAQAVLQNFSAGTDASTDLILANDSATDSTNYVDIGINSTGYTTNFFGSARDGYVYVNGSASGEGSLWLGTGQANTKVRVAVGGGGSSNVVCDFDANGINLPARTSVSAPSSGLNLFNRTRANRNLLRMLGPSGIETALQPALFGNSQIIWFPPNGTSLGATIGTAWTRRDVGTAAAAASPARASTNAITSLLRQNQGTGTTATGSSGFQSTPTVAWRGNAAGLGGFFLSGRIAVETFEAAMQILVGLSALNGALAGEPSAQNNTVCLGKDSTDANWQFIFRDGTTANKVNTGVAVNATDVLDFFIFAAPNSSSMAVQLVNAVTGASLFENTNVTSNLPVNTTFMYLHAQVRSTVGTTAKNLSINKLYLESDL